MWTSDASDVCEALGVDPAAGLSESEAARRLARHGHNELPDHGARRAWRVLVDQLRSVMVAILAVAALVSAVIGDVGDALAILAIVVLNTALGFVQEHRVERALAALRRLAVPSMRVRREGHTRELSAREVVPGDVLLLEAGDLVAADCRLVEAVALRVQESALTGEAEPVDKHTQPIADAEADTADRANCAYMGTLVVHGRGVAVATATGPATELGRVATLLRTVEREPTPLQRRLDRLGRTLAAVALGLVAVLVTLGAVRGEDPRTLVLTALGMAVAAVPEGLPAVVTVALALGTQRMLRRRAQIRKLPAVETLGSVTVICADKTGTLTQNRMEVERLAVAHGAARDDQARLVLAAALCCDASTDAAGAVTGDPTEVALVAAAARAGCTKDELDARFPRVGEVPFDPVRKRMTTIHRASSGLLGTPGGLLVVTKGAVDELLPRCDAVWTNWGPAPLDADERRRLEATSEQWASGGTRVLGVGFRWIDATPSEVTHLVGRPEELEQRMVFLGLIGLHDPPRPAAAAAVAACRAAGIRPVMITGDHPATATAIARTLGIADDRTRTLTGAELARMSVDELVDQVDEVDVYARVSPEHKLKIVESLQRRGHVVAMTGDGVNDAPALKRADIGVAMGLAGTDVAKEAADMVLLDDDFATVVAAVEEGRAIYDNVRKFVRYLMASNAGELWLMLLGPLAGMPLPLLPLQILWVNLVTDGPAALALAAEPAEPDVMRRPPHPPNEGILARGLGRQVVWVGLLMAMLAGVPGYVLWAAGDPAWQTVVFTVVVFAQMANVLAVRSERESLFRVGFRSNPPLLVAVVLTVALQLGTVYWPPAQNVLGTVALPLGHLLAAAAISGGVLFAVELEKWLTRPRPPGEAGVREGPDGVGGAGADNGVKSGAGE